MKRRKSIRIVLVVLLLAALCAGCLPGCRAIRAGLSGIIPLSAEDFAGNVFQIVTKNLGELPQSAGSGFVFNRDGWFITNEHVMHDAYYATALFNVPDDSVHESFTRLEIERAWYRDPEKDVFIGKLSGYEKLAGRYRDMALRTKYRAGDPVYSVGYPSASVDLQIHGGKILEDISSLYDKLYTGIKYIGFDSYIAPGSSGGILVNRKGEVLGMTSRGLIDENGNFVYGAAIPAYIYEERVGNPREDELRDLRAVLHTPDELFYAERFDSVRDSHRAGAENVSEERDEKTVRYAVTERTEGTDTVSAEEFTIGSDFNTGLTADVLRTDGAHMRAVLYGSFKTAGRDGGLCGFEDMVYEFRYDVARGPTYTACSDDVNYSANTGLTLRNVRFESSSFFYPVPAEMQQTARAVFNRLYEDLSGKLSAR